MADQFSPSLPLEYYNVQAKQTYYLNPYSGQYIRNRSYAQRLQRGFSAGMSRAEARGHRVSSSGLSESQQRTLRAQERGDLSPYQVFLGGFERRYGFSYQYWRLLWSRWIKDINARVWPNAPSPRMQVKGGQRADPRIFPNDIAEIRKMYAAGFRETRASSPASWQEWVENHLAQRFYAIVEYQDNHNPTPGKQLWNAREQTWHRVALPAEEIFNFQATLITAPPVEWWWYH